jgi:aminobenzoyl-glutamate utilization protein B
MVSGAVASAEEQLKLKAIENVDRLRSEVEEISQKLWDLSETALREQESAAYLAGKLEKHGFVVERGQAGMPTAFVATYGQNSPRIGILAEFDALPGVGNQAVPKRQPREDGVSSGHGCGHNLFGAASVVGAIALKEVMVRHQLKGTVKLFGTPAEETVVGKVYMAREGVFDDLDAAIDWHPATTTEVKNQSGRAMNNFEVEFFGQAAHAAADPWNGRSALDAVELLNYGVNLMREHVKPTARIHYVIPSGGDAPNVVPEYAKVWYYVRDINRGEVQELYERILRIVDGAAMATGTTSKIRLITGVHEYLLNRPLQEALQANLELVGPVRLSEVEQAFAFSLQRELGIEEVGFDLEIQPLSGEPENPEGGSTDVAEVSYIVPTVGFSVTTAAFGIPWHSWAATACHGTTAASKGAAVAAKVIAATGVDLLTNPDLLKEAQRAFAEASGGEPYESPLPAGQAVILPEEP